MEREELIKKWLDGSLTQAEQIEFDALEDSAELKRISNAMPYFKAPELKTDNDFSIIAKNKKSTTMVKRILPFAALLVIALGIAFFLNTDATVNTAAKVGEITRVDLPDTTKVTLNAVSTLIFDKNSWNEKRTTQLEGEAFFEVTEGSKFTVETPQGIVTVLGTKFNVKQRADFFEVHCYEGSVEVVHALKTVILKPGDYISVHTKQVTAGKISKMKSPAWIDGKNIFRGVPYQEVLNELSRQFGVEITTNFEPEKRLFTGAFTNDNLEEALKTVTLPLKLTYNITGKNVVIETK